jgi:hypothetical protein
MSNQDKEQKRQDFMNASSARKKLDALNRREPQSPADVRARNIEHLKSRLIAELDMEASLAGSEATAIIDELHPESEE